ncbi:GIY-YIG nuclease family protein [Paludibacterium purpuratum]|uniref:GIY-YIG nuclease family protein n=1 Tax=Paludibacterium purpuratum TaxID=1144873 RepID=UPI001FB77B37|nr:GIY-YIG nuclease family protein [Paludibacterium purpuratum]
MYVIACRGGSLYTGISTDVARRFAVHQAGKGARYTKSHPPEKLLLTVEFPNRSHALQAEYAFKQLSAAEKRAFCMRHENVSD